MYDYLLGGLNNFAADRAAAERVLTHLPQQRAAAIENRQFIDRAVRFLAAPAQGVTQFIDIGAGLPTRRSVHEVAKWENPACRVAYVDYDPLVVSHGKAMLAERDCSVVVQQDMRDPEALLSNPEILAHLDLSRPVGLIMVNILHWIPDADCPQQVLAVLRDALAPGSYLVLTHMSEELIGTSDMDAARRAARVFDTASAQLWFRDRPEVAKFFDGWQLVAPGLVPKHEWRPEGGAASIFDIAYGGVARKPLRRAIRNWLSACARKADHCHRTSVVGDQAVPLRGW
jgi:O-methyltransferase involved in polyketide biosynthesis